MNGDFKNRLLNHEVPPPDAVWDVIATELDSSAIGNPSSTALKNASVAPPDAVWSKITSSLDNNFFSADTAAKIYAIEATPPAAAWASIARTLDSEKEAAIPEHRRFAPFIRYAAAAAVIGIMIFAGTTLFSGKGDKKSATASATPDTTTGKDTNTSPSVPVNEQIITDVNAAMEEAKNDAALEESKKVYASVDVAALQKKASAASYAYKSDNNFQGPGQTRGLGEEEDIYFEPPIDADNYVVLMTPDGNFVRMSKKLGDFVCCISGEEQDKNCIDDLTRLREKMVNRPLAHSPGNFMDLISLVTSLDEN